MIFVSLSMSSLILYCFHLLLNGNTQCVIFYIYILLLLHQQNGAPIMTRPIFYVCIPMDMSSRNGHYIEAFDVLRVDRQRPLLHWLAATTYPSQHRSTISWRPLRCVRLRLDCPLFGCRTNTFFHTSTSNFFCKPHYSEALFVFVML